MTARQAGRRLLGGAIVMQVLGAAAEAATPEILRWIPSDTRVVLEIGSASTRQPRAREVLGLDALLGATAARREVARLATHITVAYVPVSGGTTAVVFGSAERDLETDFGRLHGPSLGRAGGHELFGARDGGGGALALVSRRCIVEGTPAGLRAVLDRERSRARLADLPDSTPHRRLLSAAAGTAPVSLLYLAADGGADLFAVLEDLERILSADFGAALDSYRVPLRMLGTTQGLRLDLRQERDDLASVLQLAMPNRMAAQLAEASITAGKDLARLASDTAVRAGTLTADDARQLDAVLATLQASATGDVVRVQAKLADPAALGAR